MDLDRVQREEKPGGDFRIAQSLGELRAGDDFNLFLRQAIQLLVGGDGGGGQLLVQRRYALRPAPVYVAHVPTQYF